MDTPQKITVAEVLDAAIDRLHEKGWTQNSMGGWSGPNCLTGALLHAAQDLQRKYWQVSGLGGDPAFSRAMDAVGQHLRPGADWVGQHELEAWNDHSGRSAEDVILALKGTRYELEQPDAT